MRVFRIGLNAFYIMIWPGAHGGQRVESAALYEISPIFWGYLNTWSSIGSTVWVGLGSVTLLMKWVTRDRLWSFKCYTIPSLISSSSCVRLTMWTLSLLFLLWCLPTAMVLSCDGAGHVCTVNPRNPSLLYISWVMMFSHSSGKVSNAYGQLSPVVHFLPGVF